MKTIIIVLIAVVVYIDATAQEHENGSSTYQQQLENLAAQDENETDDDAYLQHLESRRRHKLNLNKAGEEELRELNLLTDLQIHNLIRYRKLFGNLIALYEMQSIPGWDIPLIKNLLPFVTVQNEISLPANWKNWLKEGEHKLLFRFSQVLEKAKGFLKSDSGSHYMGSPLKMLFRYRYQYRDQLQYGITGDKDAGEQFFSGKQKTGFDFYSFHFFVRRLGLIKAMALGDFAINLGQGLIHWQSQAFKKSTAVMNIKRQSAVLKPYTAAGEYNFHRGAAITLQYKNWQSTIFVSLRKFDAALQQDENQNVFINSVQVSGYHRTNTEWLNRNRVKVFATGVNIKRQSARGHIGLNAIHHTFSIPFRATDEPYDRYAIDGHSWNNYSVDYSYTHANYHIYGELATDKNFNTAMIHGLLISADPKVDISMVYRRIGAAYQAFAGNAFTENSQPTNESGFYAGISFRPIHVIRLDAYADFFQFPWLRYRVDAPSGGSDYLLQITWAPNRQTELYTRFRREEKGLNQPSGEFTLPAVEPVTRKNWRSQVTYTLNKEWCLQNRVELVWFWGKSATIKKTGFLCFQDLQYSPMGKPYKASLRFQYFETDDYDTRLYTYENPVMYNASMPAFFNKGLRWMAGFQYKTSFHNIIRRKLACIWGLNISRSGYATGTVIGSGQDELPGSRKTEVRLQAIFNY